MRHCGVASGVEPERKRGEVDARRGLERVVGGAVGAALAPTDCVQGCMHSLDCVQGCTGRRDCVQSCTGVASGAG